MYRQTDYVCSKEQQGDTIREWSTVPYTRSSTVETNDYKEQLHVSYINSYVADANPYLRTKDITARFKWCITKKNGHWRNKKTVACTDEASFTLRLLKNFTKLWKNERARYLLYSLILAFRSV